MKQHISLDAVCYAIKNTLFINNISLTLKTGDRLAITGPNGSGKTTLLYLLAGILKPDHGTISISINGQHIPTARILQSCGFVGNSYNPYPELTILENLFFAFRGNLDTIHELLTTFNLNEHRYKAVKHLSSGMLQRLKIILALINEPPILLFDEPGLNLDNQGKETLYKYIQSKTNKNIIIIATNDGTESDLCSGAIDLA